MEGDKPKPKAPPRRKGSIAAPAAESPASPSTEAQPDERAYKENRRTVLTDEEREQCIELCRRHLALHHHQGQIKREVAKAMSTDAVQLEPRSVEVYITEARKQNAAALVGKTTAQLVADSYATYEAIIADPDSEPKDKVRAQNSIDQLLGLRQPIKIAHTDPTGTKSASRNVKDMTDEELLQAESVLDKMRNRGEPSVN